MSYPIVYPCHPLQATTVTMLKGTLKDFGHLTTKGREKEKSAHTIIFNQLMIIPKSRSTQAEEKIHQNSAVALGQETERQWRVQPWRFPRPSKTKPGLTNGIVLAAVLFGVDGWTGHLQRSCPAHSCMIPSRYFRVRQVPEKFKQFAAVNP